MAVTLISRDSEPTSLYDVWAPYVLVRPDWGSAFSLETSYTSAVMTADSGAETRRGLKPKPVRTVSYSANIWGTPEQGDALIYLDRLTRSRTLAPVWCDFTTVTADTAVGGSRIFCDTSNRRFSVGKWVAVYDPADGQRTLRDFELVAVADVQPGYIDITGALAADVFSGYEVVPLMVANPVFKSAATFVTDQHASGLLEFAEVLTADVLEPSADYESWPAAFDTYQTLPIVDIYNGTGSFDMSVDRMGSITEVGRGSVTQASDGKGRWGSVINAIFFPRAQAWVLRELHDAARGRLGSFWWVSESSSYEILSSTSTTIEVSNIGTETEWDERPFVGFLLENGDTEVREILSVSVGATTTLMFGALASSPLRAGPARRVRFMSDSLAESWRTDEVCEVTFELTEVVEEKTVDLGIVQRVSGVVGSEQSDPPVGSTKTQVIYPTFGPASNSNSTHSDYVEYSDDLRTIYQNRNSWQADSYTLDTAIVGGGKSCVEYQILDWDGIPTAQLDFYVFSQSGPTVSSALLSVTGANISDGDIFTIALDTTNGQVFLYRNGALFSSGTVTIFGPSSWWRCGVRSAGDFDTAIRANTGQEPLSFVPAGFDSGFFLPAASEAFVGVTGGRCNTGGLYISPYITARLPVDPAALSVGLYVGNTVLKGDITIEEVYRVDRRSAFQLYTPLEAFPYGADVYRLQAREQSVDAGNYRISLSPSVPFIDWGGSPGSTAVNSSSIPYLDYIGETLRLTYTFKSVGGRAKLYINGQLIGQSDPWAEAWLYLGDATYSPEIRIGQVSGYTHADVRVWNRELSQTEIQENLLIGGIQDTDGLVAHWLLDDSFDSSVAINSIDPAFNGTYELYDPYNNAHRNIKKYSGLVHQPIPWA